MIFLFRSRRITSITTSSSNCLTRNIPVNRITRTADVGTVAGLNSMYVYKYSIEGMLLRSNISTPLELRGLFWL